MPVAAVQPEVALADVAANLAAAEALARQAVRDGAEAIALPELFTTGAAFVPELAGAELASDLDQVRSTPSSIFTQLAWVNDAKLESPPKERKI